jgi:addiction module HigA family antidote
VYIPRVHELQKNRLHICEYQNNVVSLPQNMIENMVHAEGIDDRMIANNLEPHYLTHPGEVIKDELEARGISQRQLARSIGVPASQLNELLNAKRSLSAEMALLIGQALGLDPAPLLALQTDYNLLSAKRNKSFLERLKDIPKIAAVF